MTIIRWLLWAILSYSLFAAIVLLVPAPRERKRRVLGATLVGILGLGLAVGILDSLRS